jgi:tetratricopeptide (TPR) repeat protein
MNWPAILRMRCASFDADPSRVLNSLLPILSVVPFLLMPLAALAAPLAPSSPRESYNLGTQELKAGKLREAEALFEISLTNQNEAFQPSALYNLGLVRFAQGTEELKKLQEPGVIGARARAAVRNADIAIKMADDALASNSVDQLVEAYQRGRGVRREIKAVKKAVSKALEVASPPLLKWRRALGDFKSALELAPSDADARTNADIVDRNIAWLVDQVREIQSLLEALTKKSGELGEKMDQMKGKIPAPNMPPGAPGDDEEDQDDPSESTKPGEREGTSRDGEEMRMTREQAGWMLEGFKLDANRRLPMGQKDTMQPADKKGKNW